MVISQHLSGWNVYFISFPLEMGLERYGDFPALTGLERGGHRLEPLAMRRSPKRVFT